MNRLKSSTAYFVKFLLLVVLIVASFTYAMFQGGFVSWFIFGSFLPFAVYSILLFFYPVSNISIERVLKNTEYNAGESVEITIKINRSDRFPLFFLILEDEVSENLKERSRQNFKMMMFPFFKKDLSYQYTVEKIPRGEYSFHRFHVKTGDMLGFIQKQAVYPNENKILVFPSYVEMVYEPFENQFEQGMTATKDKVQRDSTMAISIREYEPGDRFSWIHWKASARKNDIMTKEFEQRQTHDTMVVLDRTPSNNFELAVTFAASVIRAILKKGAEVGLYSFGEKNEFFPVRRGEFQQRTLFYHLAGVEDDANLELSKVIDSEKTLRNQNRTTIFILSQLQKPSVDAISSFGLKKGSVILFLIKGKGEKASGHELAMLEVARRRGVISKVIYEGEFEHAFGRGEW